MICCVEGHGAGLGKVPESVLYVWIAFKVSLLDEVLNVGFDLSWIGRENLLHLIDDEIGQFNVRQYLP